MSPMERHFYEKQAQDYVRWQGIVKTQVRNAIIEIEDDDIESALERLKSLIGESDNEQAKESEG